MNKYFILGIVIILFFIACCLALEIEIVRTYLNDRKDLAPWLQFFCIVITALVALNQLQQFKESVKSLAESNNINLQTNVANLLANYYATAINVDLQTNNKATPASLSSHGKNLLHHFHILYFYRTWRLRPPSNENISGAEEAYLRSVAKTAGFLDAWMSEKDHYDKGFQAWMNLDSSEGRKGSDAINKIFNLFRLWKIKDDNPYIDDIQNLLNKNKAALKLEADFILTWTAEMKKQYDSEFVEWFDS